MAFVALLPGDGFMNETQSITALVPEAGFVNETRTSSTGTPERCLMGVGL